MRISDEELTRQEDEVTISDSPKEVDQYKFGYWPEVVGLIMALVIIWIVFQ